MLPSPYGKTGPLAKAKPVPQSDYPARLDEQEQFATDAEPLQALQRQYAAFGLGLYQLTGRALLVSGPHMASRSMPDERCARLFLRQLKGAAK